MTKEQLIERYGLEWYNDHNEKMKAYLKERYKNDSEYRKYKIHYTNHYIKNRYKTDPEYREYRKHYINERHKNNPEEYNAYSKKYLQNDLNSYGKTKSNIRAKSRCILFKERRHAKLKDYEIHHCFGYDDPSKFIYIPKSLHNKIHQYLRDNNIDTDNDHYDVIKYILNDCQEYTYISV